MKMSPAMAAIVIVSTLAYLAIAAFGAGGIDVFLARPPFVAFVLVTVALAIASLATEGGIRPGEREDRGNRWVLAAFGVIGLPGPIFPRTPTASDFGRSTAIHCAGSASCSMPQAAFCASGRSSCWGVASAGWSRSSPDIHS